MNELTDARNARAEAEALVPEGRSARVLEPSPPAVDDGDTFADDPTALDGADPATTVRPVGHGPRWDELATDDDAIAAFASERWLGNWRRLGPVPNGHVSSRADYHRLAYGVVAMARHEENGRFGLRFTAGGFGTPFFGADRQVRMVGNVLVDQRGDDVRTTTPASMAEAAAFLDVEVTTTAAEEDSPTLDDAGDPLDLRPDVGAFLGDWFGFVTSVLEELRSEQPADANVSRVQLWPGHFDPAFEAGDQDAGHRATIGGSPGDHGSDEPYLYVGPWAGATDDDYWNATAFPGAVLPYSELVEADDQRAAALDFYRRGVELLRNR